MVDTFAQYFGSWIFRNLEKKYFLNNKMFAEKLSHFLFEDYKMKLDTFNLNTGEIGVGGKWRGSKNK